MRWGACSPPLRCGCCAHGTFRQAVDTRAGASLGIVYSPRLRRWGVGTYPPAYIQYEEAFEDEIVEAIGRLDEIGDLIDGDVSPEEAHDLIRLLDEA